MKVGATFMRILKNLKIARRVKRVKRVNNYESGVHFHENSKK